MSNTEKIKNLQLKPSDQKKPLPFVKWAGGKRSILSTIAEYVPCTFQNYYEPFLGGGALFYFLRDRLTKAYLSDINFELITAYIVIKNNLDLLITSLKNHQSLHSQKYYYRVRNHSCFSSNPVDVASRFLYLNKTCYNGFYRVNSKGIFNVPVGKYKNLDVVREDNLRLCSDALKCAQISLKNFRDIQPRENDFVYFDPPYHPKEGLGFRGYTGSTFTALEQTQLRDFALKLHGKGVKVMLSNSDALLIKKLYSGSPFIIRSFKAPRRISCKANDRHSVEEVLITTYE